jgi:hypothetical protein
VRSIVLAALALCAPVQLLTQAAAAAQAHDTAARLAVLVLPRDRVVAVRVPRNEAVLMEELAEDSRFAELQRRPALLAAARAAIREETTKAYQEAVALLQVDVARIYRARFTPAELETVIAFVASPTGQALVELSIAAEGETASGFEADRRRKIMALLSNPSPQAKADLTRFMQSGLMAKTRALAPEVSSLSERRFEDVETLMRARLPARLDRLAETHTKKQP